jgi:2-amino-4-hydroxy-6-hydroxymethyldihydropteridine diphosphokinase
VLLSLQKPKSDQPERAKVYIAVGSNHHMKENIQAALTVLAQQDDIDNISISPTFESRAVGFDGAEFWNLVISLTTHLNRKDLILELKKIEDKQGRIRDKNCAIKSLDLDLLHHCQDQPDIIHQDAYSCLYVYKPYKILMKQTCIGNNEAFSNVNERSISNHLNEHWTKSKCIDIDLKKINIDWTV